MMHDKVFWFEWRGYCFSVYCVWYSKEMQYEPTKALQAWMQILALILPAATTAKNQS